MELLQNTIRLMEPVALAIVLTFAYGQVRRHIAGPTQSNIILGLLFGAGAMISILDPIIFAERFIADMRSLFVGLAAGLFGLLPGLIAAVIAGATRLMIGGDGVGAGIVAIALSMLGGLAWRWIILKDNQARPGDHLLLGLFISVHLCATVLLPAEIIWGFLQKFVPAFVAINLLGSLLIGGLLNREDIAISRAQQLEEEARTDPLTQIMNRRSAIEAVGRLGDTRNPSKGRAMLTMDVDNFKTINDTLGHAAGDTVLRQLTDRLKEVLRPGDVFSRLGGDEFLIVLPDVSPNEAKAIGQRCCCAVSAVPMAFGAHPINVTISVGVQWTARPAAFNAHLAAADEALYKAKSEGRNRVTFQASSLPENAAA